MPAPIVPPPSNDIGAITWPRQLQRWLDVNRITKLDRVGMYITLPAFTQSSNTWNGYSDIVESFNYEGPNACSLLGVTSSVPTNPNFVLTVSYRIGTLIIRYLIWDATGSVLNQDIPVYQGQPLKKNWRFEIWNTSQGVASLSAPIQFTTSVLGKIDYRWGTDSTLVNADVPCTNFADGLISAPAVSDQWTMSGQVFTTTDGVTTLTGWTPFIGSGSWLLNGGNNPVPSTIPGSGVGNGNGTNPVGDNPSVTFNLGSSTTPLQSIYIVFNGNGSNQNKDAGLFIISGTHPMFLGIRIGWYAGYAEAPQYGIFSIALTNFIPLDPTKLNMVLITFTNTSYTVYGYNGDVLSPINFTTNYINSQTNAAGVIEFNPIPTFMSELGVISTNTGNVYSLPITFPSNAVSTIN